jgi:hypothetical protein
MRTSFCKCNLLVRVTILGPAVLVRPMSEEADRVVIAQRNIIELLHSRGFMAAQNKMVRSRQTSNFELVKEADQLDDEET